MVTISGSSYIPDIPLLQCGGSTYMMKQGRDGLGCCLGFGALGCRGLGIWECRAGALKARCKRCSRSRVSKLRIYRSSQLVIIWENCQ